MKVVVTGGAGFRARSYLMLPIKSGPDIARAATTLWSMDLKFNKLGGLIE